MVHIKRNISGGHRGRLDIIADILEVSLREGVKKTYLMYKCNLSFKQLNYYLQFMLNKGFINVVKEKNSNPRLFKTTRKGKDLLKAYKDLKSLMK